MFVLLLIEAHDQIKKSASKIFTTCTHLQVGSNCELDQHEYLKLSSFVYDLHPVLNIHGLFKIDRKLIPSLASGFVTYVIILIQLKE